MAYRAADRSLGRALGVHPDGIVERIYACVVRRRDDIVSTEVTTGLFTLSGVVVGGLITGAVQVALEHRHQSSAIAIAKRLLIDELHNMWSHLEMVRDEGKAPQALPDDVRSRFLPTSDWEKYRETLARPAALSDAQWVALSNFVQSVEALRMLLFSLAPRAPLPPDVDVDGLTKLAEETFQLIAGYSVGNYGDS